MKKLILFALLLAILPSLFACGGEPPQAEENFVYTPDSDLSIVRKNDGSIGVDVITAIRNAVSDARGRAPSLLTDDQPETEHEIVLGRTSRQISAKAYAVLDSTVTDDGDVAYVIYSDGRSVAIAYTDAIDAIALGFAVKHLTDEVLGSDRLELAAGVVKSYAKSPLDYYKEQDSLMINERWTALEEQIGLKCDANLTKEIITSLKRLYSLYTDDMITWLANLYDPGVGGWYYSNSARDNVGYLPDVESTKQALTFLVDSGMAEEIGDYPDAIPESARRAIGDFVLSLPDPDGYFYHPQWGKNITNSRQGRDLSSSTSILKKLGLTPKYKLPTAAAKALTPDFRNTGATLAVSSTLPTASLENVPERFRSEESFRAYLASLDIENKSYSVGNELQSSVSQIKSYGSLIGVDLLGIMMDWLDEHQNPETGLWHYENGYYATNSLHKIFSVYNSARREIPNVEKSIASAIASITSDKPLGSGVDIYNAWSVIQYVYTNIRYVDQENADARIAEILAPILASAPAMIDATYEKIAVFRKPDGSFSYSPQHSSATSQGAPVAIPNSAEGDVNGNAIASTALVSHLFGALELGKIVPLYTYSDLLTFNKILENAHPVLKNDPEPEGPETFDNRATGDAIPTVGIKDNSNAGSGIAHDPRGDGKVYKLVSTPGHGDTVSVMCPTDQSSSSCYVFEAELCVESSTDTYAVQISLGKAYMFNLRIKNGRVNLYDSSSNKSVSSFDYDLGISVPVGEWFSVKVEHYVGDHSTVRTVFYLNGTPVAVSDNYLGKPRDGSTATPTAIYSYTSVYVLSSADITLLLDDLRSYGTADAYKPVKLENPEWLNVDRHLVEEK